MSDSIKIGNTPFYDFTNGDLRRAFTTTVNITHVLGDETKTPLLFDPAKLDIGALKDQPMSVSCPYPVLQWHSFSAEQEEREQQEPMTLERAVEILNERKHDGHSNWCLSGDSQFLVYDSEGEYPDRYLSEFEVCAIAKAYLEQK